jgi:hypothetical protein
MTFGKNIGRDPYKQYSTAMSFGTKIDVIWDKDDNKLIVPKNGLQQSIDVPKPEVKGTPLPVTFQPYCYLLFLNWTNSTELIGMLLVGVSIAV